MADADGRIIPHVGDDQGEGIKDFLDQEEILLKKVHEKVKEDDLSFQMKIRDTLEKGKSDSEMIQLILDKLEAIERKIDLIFGGQVLINGQWKKPDPEIS